MARQRLGQERVATAQFGRVIFTIAADVTAWQNALFCPRRTDSLIVRRQFFHRVFGQLTVGRQLTTKDRQQRRFAVFVVDIQRVITGDSLRRVGLVIAQRTYARVGPDDIVTAQLFLKVRVVDLQQVIDFTLINFYRFRVAFVFDVSRPDDREFVHPWDDKHNTFIFVLQNISLLLGMDARHHDVAAFNQTNTVRRWQMHAVVEELFHPWAGGIDQTTRLPGVLFTGIDIFSFNNPQTVFTASGGSASAG